MEMVNLRWTKSERSFPMRVGGEEMWYAIYAGVVLPMERSSFEKGFGQLFFVMDRFNRMMRDAVGDIPIPYEFRTPEGKYEPW